MPKIIPIRDLKDTSHISNLVKESDGPVYVTKNGYEDMVILQPEEYQRLVTLNEIYVKLAEAERAISSGRVRDSKDVMADVRKKYGL